MIQALIIGMDSGIGSALHRILIDSGWSVSGTSRKKDKLSSRVFYLDLANVADFNLQRSFDVIFICACVTKIAECRLAADYTQKINQDTPVQLAHYFLKLNPSTHIIFLSTSAVFNGQKPRYHVSDVTCPITNYGRFKEKAEKNLLNLTDKVTILRLTKVLTSSYPLVLQWIKALSGNTAIEPFYDLQLCPIPITSVLYCLKEIVEKKLFGIIHLSGDLDVTYLEVAQWIIRKMKKSSALIKQKSAMASGILIEEAPCYSSLDMTESNKLFALSKQTLDMTLTHLYGDILCSASFVHQ